MPTSPSVSSFGANGSGLLHLFDSWNPALIADGTSSGSTLLEASQTEFDTFCWDEAPVSEEQSRVADEVLLEQRVPTKPGGTSELLPLKHTSVVPGDHADLLPGVFVQLSTPGCGYIGQCTSFFCT
jgi:hypothetical protein